MHAFALSQTRLVKTRCCRLRLISMLLAAIIFPTSMLALPATTTMLTVTNGGFAASSIPPGGLVTLTATVNSGGVPLARGQVAFCDAAAPYCVDFNMLGMAQITSSGTAILRLHPALGSHSYKAVFLGTTSYGTSASQTASLSVSGQSATTTTLVSDPNSGTLLATVSSIGSAPTGSVSLIDTTNAGSTVASGNFSGSTFSLGYTNSSKPSGTVPLIGDFNGDGIADLISNATVMLGNGDGTFTALTQGAGMISANVVGDFNGDGKLDIASASGVMLGNGDGTFNVGPGMFPALTTEYTYATAIAGDFNHDGNQDLAFLTHAYASTAYYITTLLGAGDGTFTALASTIPAGSHSISMVSGDFNGDGNVDIAVSGSDGPGYLIFLGKGDGAFTTAPSISSVSNYGIAAGDFNEDGLTDIAGASGIYLSRGDGTFGAVIPYTGAIAQYNGGDLNAVGDFNGDGKLDLVVPGSGTQYVVAVALGNGDGTFGSLFGTGSTAGLSAANVSVADLNGDGYPDMIVGNQFSGSNLNVFLGQPTLGSTASFSGIVPIGTGTHLLNANYLGNVNFKESSSNALGVAAQMVTPTLTLSVNPTSSSYGQQVVLSAAISPVNVQNVTTTGQTIRFYSGTVYLGPSVFNSGVGTLNTTALPAGMTSLTAVYGGNAYFNSATSNAVAYTVNGAAPTISFIVGNHAYGDAPFTVSATSTSTGAFTYSVIAGPATISGATVTLTGTGTVVLQASETAAGAYNAGVQQATFTVAVGSQTISFPALASPVSYGVAPVALAASASSGLPVTFSVMSGPGTIIGSALSITGVGTVIVAAGQAGNANYAAAPSVSQMVVVSAAIPLVTFQQPQPITYGTALGGVLTATAASGGTNIAGNFTYKTGTSTVTSATVLPAGSYPVVAMFTPTDATRYTGAGAMVTLVVSKATPSIALASSLNPGQVQNAIGLTTTVSSSASTPTGTVSFFDGGAMIGSVTLANGAATISLALSAGSHSVTAVYNGDSNFGVVTSAVYAESVQDINLAGGTGTSQTITAGATASYTLSISPVNGSTFQPR